MYRGLARNLLRGRGTKEGTGDKRDGPGRKSPIGVQGQSPGGGLRAKPPEAGDTC